MRVKLFAVLIALFSMSFVKQNVKEVVIKTSAECGMCKERIEEKLNYTKGVSYVDLDVSTKLLTVKYKEDKISVDKIREIVSNLGYDADDVKANQESQNALPGCCQPHGMK